MKLSIILFIGVFFQMQAETGLGQDNRISLDLQSASIHRVIETIESKSDYRFFYSREELDLGRTVSVGVRKVKIEAALDAIFRNTDVQYKILEYQIVLTRKPVIEIKTMGIQEEMLHLPKLLPLQFEKLIPVFSVTGTVTDVEGEALIGVNIQVKGTNKGASTDLEGHFTLDDIDENAVLVISYIGYETQEVSVAGETSLSITMVSDSQLLDEVVVVGYGTMKKINLTGAVDVITNKNIENRQSSTVSQILQGQSPGLNFSVGASGFEPGASMNIDIRGMGSLNGGSPFVVIDGFPGSMDRLNPNDIESISILKDAAASAIYGARAPYGVILITTKSGKKNEKLSISYSGNMSINTPDRLPKMLDSYEFSRVVNEMGSNGGGRPYADEAVDRIIAYKNKDWDYLRQFYPSDATHFETMPLSNGRWGNNNNAHANYDWYDEFYGNSLNQQHNISVRGGSEKTAYYLSAGFVGQEGVLNYGTDTYQRYNLTGKINTSLTDWWDVKYETRFMKSPREYPTILRNWGYQMIFRQIPRTVPTEAKYTGYGTYAIQSKIPFIEDSGTNLETTTENWHTAATEIRPAKGWKINGEFAYRSVGFTASNLNLTFYEHLVDGSYIPNAQSVPNSIQKIQRNNFYWTTNVYTSYDVDIAKHNILALVGTQYELNKTNQLNATKTNLIVPDVPSLQTSNGEAVVSENLGHWSTNGYFGRLAYNFDQKYLFEANARYDGTSRFQRGSRWGFFPSFSVGWNLNRESFWENIQNHVNVFKIRASWGQLGNQQVSPYQDISLIPLRSGMLNWLWSYGSSRPLGYTGTPGLVSPHLTWETATSKNVGLNLAFLDNRLQLDFDLFERITDNMIGPSEPVPGVLVCRALSS